MSTGGSLKLNKTQGGTLKLVWGWSCLLYLRTLALSNLHGLRPERQFRLQIRVVGLIEAICTASYVLPVDPNIAKSIIVFHLKIVYGPDLSAV